MKREEENYKEKFLTELNEVVKEISSLSDEEFWEGMEKHKNGDIAKILQREWKRRWEDCPECAVLRKENAAQLEELRLIAESLGTNEGHSSVDHIKNLRKALELSCKEINRIDYSRCTQPKHFIEEARKG